MDKMNELMKWLLTAATILVALGLVLLLVHLNKPSEPLNYSTGPVTVLDIAKTEKLKVLTIRKEVLAHQHRISSGLLRKNEERIYVIYPATLHFGFDLTRCDRSSIRTHGDSVSVVLPPVQVLNHNGRSVDEALKRTAIEEGEWSATEMTNLRNRAEAIMLRQCEYDGCYDRAEQAGVSAVRAMLASLGYSHIEVSVRKRANKGLCLIDKNFRSNHSFKFFRNGDKTYLSYQKGDQESRLYYTPGNISLRELLAMGDYFMLFFDQNPRHVIAFKKDNQLALAFLNPTVTAGSKEDAQVRSRASKYDMSPLRHAIGDLIFGGKVSLTIIETDKKGNEIFKY